MLHLLLLSISVYLRHSSAEADANPNWGLEISDARTGIRLASELGTIASTLCYIILQQGDEIKNQGLVAYFKQLVSYYYVGLYYYFHYETINLNLRFSGRNQSFCCSLFVLFPGLIPAYHLIS